MTNQRIARGLAALCMLAALSTAVAAQGVAVGNTYIRLEKPTGATVLLDHDATLYLGGPTAPGLIELRDESYNGTVFVDAETADIFLGLWGQDGDLILWDNDGTSLNPSVHLDGNQGWAKLGNAGGSEDGDLWIYDYNGDRSIYMDGNTGDVVNDKLGGNGLVKAWAKINANGTVHSCWRCDPNRTSAQTCGGAGIHFSYKVSFLPLGADIQSRPRLATLDGFESGESSGQIDLIGNTASGQTDKIGVYTRNSSGDCAHRGFTLFVF